MIPGRSVPLYLGIGLFLLHLAGAPSGRSIAGEWITEDGNAIIEIVQSDSLYDGTIIWAQKEGLPGDSLRDIHNPDSSRRTAPIVGLRILKDFRADGGGTWSDGSVYDPESGNTYRGTITMVDSTTLRLRGYILLPLFGRTTIWTRWHEK